MNTTDQNVTAVFVIRRRRAGVPITVREGVEQMERLGEVESAYHPGGDRCLVMVSYKYRDASRQPVKVCLLMFHLPTPSTESTNILLGVRE